jgi:hypothetical protein
MLLEIISLFLELGVVLGQGLQTLVVAQAKSSTKDGLHRLKKNKMNDFIKLVFSPLHSLNGGYLYMLVGFFIGCKCPLNCYKFGEYSP